MSNEVDEAQHDLDCAVEKMMAVFNNNQVGVTQYVLVAGHEVVDGDDELTTTYEVVVGSNDIPMHNALGLVEYAKQYLLANCRRDD